MKKNILYLLMAFVAVIFASCNPLKDAINDITPTPNTKNLVLTFTTAYTTVDAANTGISKTLNSTYPQLADGSVALVTYNSTSVLPAQFKPADSILSGTTQYKVVDADYAAINNNANKNFTTAKAIQFLDTKFPVKVANQLIVLNYVYYESGATTTSGVPATDTYIYLNGAWVKTYTVSQAQYIALGKLSLFNFGSADEPNLVSYFNTLLKADASVSSRAKAGDIKYVSFTYYISNTKENSQRVKVLVFDGVNWAYKAISATNTLQFLKKKGTWIPDPTVYYTLVKADWTIVGNSDAGTPAGRANYAQFGSFDFTGGANSWTDAQINDALIAVLNAKYPTAPVDPTVSYNLTFAYYKGPKPTAVKSFVKTDAGFVYVPTAP